jgi:predicted acetyltransferase
MNAVETLIMQAVLKSVKDYNNSIEMLGPAVKKYFKDNYNENRCYFDDWKFIDNGSNIKIAYMEDDLNADLEFEVEYKTDIIPTQTIVSIAVELSLNKKL